MFTEILDRDNVGIEPEIVAVSHIQAEILGFSIYETGNGKGNGGVVMWTYVYRDP
jgi:hypothetical protein